MPWPKPGLAATTGVLLDCRCDLVKLCGVLGVPGKDDVDLRIGGHGHDNAAIGVQALLAQLGADDLPRIAEHPQ